MESLFIPSISLKTELCFESDACLKEGVWVKTIDIQKNIILTGHSFILFPLKSGVFANIDKLKIGDNIFLYIDGEEYMYKVVDRFVTNPNDIEVESQEFVQSLTMYTCYPIMTANYRYVVRAELMY